LRLCERIGLLLYATFFVVSLGERTAAALPLFRVPAARAPHAVNAWGHSAPVARSRRGIAASLRPQKKPRVAAGQGMDRCSVG
jgi:hypothetical protein